MISEKEKNQNLTDSSPNKGSRGCFLVLGISIKLAFLSSLAFHSAHANDDALKKYEAKNGLEPVENWKDRDSTYFTPCKPRLPIPPKKNIVIDFNGDGVEDYVGFYRCRPEESKSPLVKDLRPIKLLILLSERGTYKRIDLYRALGYNDDAVFDRIEKVNPGKLEMKFARQGDSCIADLLYAGIRHYHFGGYLIYYWNGHEIKTALESHECDLLTIIFQEHEVGTRIVFRRANK